MAFATRARLMKQVFGALAAEDRATMARLLHALDEAASPLAASASASVRNEL